MGKMKWGGYCPKNMSWNSGRYKNGKCTAWQHHLYNSWYNHGSLGFIPQGDSFENFVNFVEWFEQQPLASAFKQNHELYDFDKDGLGGHMFTASSLQIVLESTNIQIMHVQNPHATDMARQRFVDNVSTPVRAISPDGLVYRYNSVTEAEKLLGAGSNAIGNCCKGKHGKHNITRGNLKDWVFYYE